MVKTSNFPGDFSSEVATIYWLLGNPNHVGPEIERGSASIRGMHPVTHFVTICPGAFESLDQQTIGTMGI